MSKRSKRFGSGWVSLKTGLEGPRHDPYRYEEWTVDRSRSGGPKVLLHLGLAEWIKVTWPGGKTWNVPIRNVRALTTIFEKLSGASIKVWERSILRIRPCCDRPEPHSVEGLPGEDLTVCGRCGKIVDVDFSIGAVI